MAKAQNKPATAAELPRAELVDRDAVERVDPYRTAKLVGFVVMLVAGWAFIVGSNRFHVTAPVVVVCLSYLAVLFTIVNLWRTGASAAAPADEDAGWGRPVGARGELEKEKRTLLKGIKEAEFDAAMGKLSKADSESLIREYRAAGAIEVIKEIDTIGEGSALSTREQIEREVKARIALDASDKPSNRAKNVRNAAAAKAEARAEARAKFAGKSAPKSEGAGSTGSTGKHRNSKRQCPTNKRPRRAPRPTRSRRRSTSRKLLPTTSRSLKRRPQLPAPPPMLRKQKPKRPARSPRLSKQKQKRRKLSTSRAAQRVAAPRAVRSLTMKENTREH